MRDFRPMILGLVLLASCAPQTPASPPVPQSSTPFPSSTPTQVFQTPTEFPRVTPASIPAPTSTRVAYKPGSPLPLRTAPRTLLDASDIARMKQWIEKYAWAKDARDQIVKNADAYPARYLQKYNLAAPDLPPTGGQWSLWYICPDGFASAITCVACIFGCLRYNRVPNSSTRSKFI